MTPFTKFEYYTIIQLISILLLCLFGMEWVINTFVFWLIDLENPHSLIKWLLESSQGMILRHKEVFWSSILLGMMSTVACLMPRFKRNLGLMLIALFVFLVFPYRSNNAFVFTVLMLCCWTLDVANIQGIKWIPIIGFQLPNLAFPDRNIVFRSLLVGGLTIFWHVVIIWLDCLLAYDTIRDEMERWPVELLDERIQVRAQNPGIRADWHGVDIWEDYAIVMAEESMRLMAFPLEGGDPIIHPLGKRWGRERAAPLDVVYDEERNVHWYLADSHTLQSVQLQQDGEKSSKTRWVPQHFVELPKDLSYTYMRLNDGQFVLAPIQVKSTVPTPFFVLQGRAPNWQDIRILRNHPQSLQLSYPREIALIPEHQQLVLAPDFGTHLYLFDLETGHSETLLETPTLDGKMRWVEEYQRLFVALPNRTEIWVIDPVKKEVDWVIPTQLGVRALEIDAKRGLIVNASVLTGQILIQDIHTGAIKDRLGTVMPMVRELALEPQKGIAVLTTWAAVYQFPYVSSTNTEKDP